MRADTTNHSRAPTVPTPRNSPAWNSTNPISAAAVSTARRPHSWARRRPPDKTRLITWSHPCNFSPKYVDPDRQRGFMAELLKPLKSTTWFKKVPTLRDQRQRAAGDRVRLLCFPDTTNESFRKLPSQEKRSEKPKVKSVTSLILLHNKLKMLLL